MFARTKQNFSASYQRIVFWSVTERYLKTIGAEILQIVVSGISPKSGTGFFRQMCFWRPTRKRSVTPRPDAFMYLGVAIVRRSRAYVVVVAGANRPIAK
jgi:hypothetical protein